MRGTKRERLENHLQEISLNYNRKKLPHDNTDKLAPYTGEFSIYVSQGFLPKTLESPC